MLAAIKEISTVLDLRHVASDYTQGYTQFAKFALIKRLYQCLLEATLMEFYLFDLIFYHPL